MNSIELFISNNMKGFTGHNFYSIIGIDFILPDKDNTNTVSVTVGQLIAVTQSAKPTLHIANFHQWY